MLAEQRRQAIVAAVRSRGAVRLASLVDELGVSDMTVRRDIAELAARGLVDRVHGGALAPRATSTDEPGFAAKSVRAVAAKRAIAREAAALVAPGSSVAVSAGTTTHAVAPLLREVPGLTVVTNSLPVADLLSTGARRDTTVLLTGGLRTPSDGLVGPMAVAALRDVNVDLVLLGAHGMDPERGLTTPTLEEAATNRALVASARRVVALVDSSKWQAVGLATALQLDDVDVLVTDTGIDPLAREETAARVGRLVLADPGPEAAASATADRPPTGTLQEGTPA